MEFMGLICLATLLICIGMFVVVRGIKGSIVLLSREMNLFSQRLDHLRRELAAVRARQDRDDGDESGVKAQADRSTVATPSYKEHERVAKLIGMPSTAKKQDDQQPVLDLEGEPGTAKTVSVAAAAKTVAAPAARSVPPPIPAPAPLRPSSAAPSPPGMAGPHMARPGVTESPLIETTREILRKIWAWILVGEEHRPTGITSEYAIASTWLVRVGILALLMGVAYFLKWSIEQGLLGDQARTLVSIVAGIGMLTAGMKLLGRRYSLIGQGLLAGGICVLYFSGFAAGPLYGLVPILVAFALMFLVTVTACFLAVRADSLLIAVLGIIGGYLTPVALSSDAPNLAVLFSYVLLLCLGILAIARFKQWHLLNLLGFVCTYALFIWVLCTDYTRPDFALTLSFLLAVFVVHASIGFLNNLVEERQSSLLDIGHTVVNAMACGGIGYWLIRQAVGRPYPALLSLALAGFYVVHVVVFLRKRLIDRNLLIALLALAGVFTTLTLPLAMAKESLSMALSLLAFMFLWLGHRMGCHFVRSLGYAVYAVVFARLLFLDLPRNFGAQESALAPMADYWSHMWWRLWNFGFSIGSVVAAFFLQKKMKAKAYAWVDEENDTADWMEPGVAGQTFYWFGLLFAFLFVHLELWNMFRYWQPFRLPVLTLAWCGMGAYFLWQYLTERRAREVMFGAMTIFVWIAVLKLCFVDLASWELGIGLVYNVPYAGVAAGARLFDFAIVVAALAGVWSFLDRKRAEGRFAPFFGYGALGVLFVYASLEVNSVLHWKLPIFQSAGVSVLWALFGIAFVAAGIWKSVRPLRYTGLALFAIVVVKVFVVDLKGMPVISRVIAFMVLGTALLLGSFSYLYSSGKFREGNGGAS